MTPYACLSLFLLAISAAAAVAEDPIGFKLIDLPDAAGNRPLHVGLWYPTDDRGAVEAPGENAVFYGVPAVTDATPTGGNHPLVVLSHGYGGSWRNLGWVAQALAEQGYVVAAPDHPGTTTFDRSPDQAAQLWKRPQQLLGLFHPIGVDELRDVLPQHAIDRARYLPHPISATSESAPSGIASGVNRAAGVRSCGWCPCPPPAYSRAGRWS